MHRGLQIPEVLREVVSHLVPQMEVPFNLNAACLREWDSLGPLDRDDPQPPFGAPGRVCYCWRCGQMALASMARTCKDFYEPATDGLWAVVVGARPLLGCDHLDTSMLNRYAVPCLSANTVRIKHLVLKEPSLYYDCLAQSHALEALTHNPSSSASTIFPKLRILEMGATLKRTDPYRLFLGPQLRHLMVRCQSQHRAVSIISTAAKRCLQLQAVDLRLDISQLALTTAMTTHWSNVRSFVCSGASGRVSGEAITSLARLPALEELEISPPRTMPSSRGDADFASLTRLYMSCGPGERVAQFLRHIPSHSLQELTVDMFLGHADTNDIFDTISRFSKLRVLYLDRISKPRVGMPKLDFQPLLSLGRLQVVDLHWINGCNAFTDDFISTLGQSWPELVSFSVRVAPRRALPIPGLTIACLPHFVQKFSNLEYLRIPLDTTNVATIPMPTANCDRAMKLDLQDGVIREDIWSLVATYISAVFPNATLVHRQHGLHLDTEWVKWWRLVADALQGVVSTHFPR